jgi:hypothetical protein
MTDWSHYQRAIFDFVEDPAEHAAARSAVVVARAGSGKTTTLIASAARYPIRGRMAIVAFANKSKDRIEASGPPKHFDVTTLHSLGLTLLKRHNPRLKVDKEGEKLLEIVGLERGLTPAQRKLVASVVKVAKTRLLMSEPEIESLLLDMDDGELASREDVDVAARAVSNVLFECRERDGLVDFDDMIWLPVELGLSAAHYRVLLVDELQDMTRAQTALVASVTLGGRVLGFGDPAQCHPPGTMIDVGGGAAIPIENLRDGERVRGWERGSQRMGAGRTIRVARRPYVGEMLDVRVGASIAPMTPNHKVLARWSDRTPGTCVTYLMYRHGFGCRVGWCQLFMRPTASGSGALHLPVRHRLERADATWILKVHSTRTEASAYESIVAATYGLPTITFEPVKGAQHLTEATIAHVFRELWADNGSRGAACLKAHGLAPELPFYPWPNREKDAPQGRRTFFEVYAANLIPEMMSLPTALGPWVPVSKVWRRPYSGDVYSLDVDRDHSYAANGVVVLNCIYQFAGACDDAVGDLAARTNAVKLPLSISYRCPLSVIEEAQLYVPDIEARPNAPDGKVVTNSNMHAVRVGDLVLSRTNAPLLRQCIAFVRAGVPAYVAGRAYGEELTRLLDRARSSDTAAFLRYLEGWARSERQKLEAAGKPTDRVDDRLACFHALADGASTIQALRSRLGKLFTPARDGAPAVVFSTVHQMKGDEYDRVFVLDDTFRLSREKFAEEPEAYRGKEEANLRYVAVTRAKRELHYVAGIR